MTDFNRRKFLATSGVMAAGLLVNFGPAAWARSENPDGSPYPEGFRDVHGRLIVIDGINPLLVGTFKPEHIDWWIQGGCTATSVTVGGGNLEDDATTKVVSWFAQQIETRPELMLIRSAEDVRTAKREDKFGIFYNFQGPSSLGIELDRVWYYKQLGVGVIQMAYNTRNPYANGINERVDGGLSILGQKLVQRCNEAKVIVDVSHTGPRSGFDALDASSAPVIVSHGNAFGKIDSPRNVPDELLKAVAENGGIAGAVGYPPFVSKNERPTMDDMVGMIDYMVELMGIDHVSIGADYDSTIDGVKPLAEIQAQYDYLVANGQWDPAVYPPPPYHYPAGIELPNTLYNLTGALLKRGYTEEDIQKIWGGNWLRIMEQVWGA